MIFLVSLVNSLVRHIAQPEQNYQLLLLCDSWSCSWKALRIWKSQ